MNERPLPPDGVAVLESGQIYRGPYARLRAGSVGRTRNQGRAAGGEVAIRWHGSDVAALVVERPLGADNAAHFGSSEA